MGHTKQESVVIPLSVVDEPDDPLYWKIKAALENLQRAPDPEELRKQNEELDRIEREDGLEALQKELRRRVGLE
ncbi:MAG: hypothetical protein J4432_00090 [DPANN group archaeon]|nr:hypothetical protein [DPANN group archaeon]